MTIQDKKQQIIHDYYCNDSYSESCDLDCDYCKNETKEDIDELERLIRADVIDELKKRTLTNFCCYCNQQACDGGMAGSIQECETIRMIRDVLEDISDELKEQE